MDWYVIGGAVLIGAGLGVVITRKSAQHLRDKMQLFCDQLLTDSATDRGLLLSTLRRELVNYMVRRNPERFFEVFRKALDAFEDIEKADASVRKAQLTVLNDKYKFYQDFDTLSTREHVLYEDVLGDDSVEDIEARYLDLMKFHALQCSFDENWGVFQPSRDEEHLEKYIRRIKDTSLKQRIAAAVDQYRDYKKNDGVNHLDEGYLFMAKNFTLHGVFHVAETRYGVHFRDTGEYGIYAYFIDDDRLFEGYYRSNSDFSTEEHLHVLRGVETSLNPTN